MEKKFKVVEGEAQEEKRTEELSDLLQRVGLMLRQWNENHPSKPIMLQVVKVDKNEKD